MQDVVGGDETTDDETRIEDGEEHTILSDSDSDTTPVEQEATFTGATQPTVRRL